MNRFTQIGFAALTSVALLSLAQKAPLAAQSSSCMQWSEFKQQIQNSESNRFGKMLRFQELPNGFKQGCISYDRGNTLHTAYVSRDGQPLNLEGIDRLVETGNALQIQWIFASNGTLEYLKRIPRNQAFTRTDGRVCFENVCLLSKHNSKQELLDLLNASKSTNKSDVQAELKSVIGQFYTGYVSRTRFWRDAKDLIDPATYDQLSRVPLIDVEPFTNVQVGIWSYTIGTPSIKGNQAEVPVTVMAGLRRAETPINLRLVLRKNSNNWQIRNVIYSDKPLPSGEPYDLLHLWKPVMSEKEIIGAIAKLPEVQQMRKAVESYQGEKLTLSIGIEQSANLSDPVVKVGVYENHKDHRTTLQRFLVNSKTQEIRVVDPLGRGSFSLEEWRKR